MTNLNGTLFFKTAGEQGNVAQIWKSNGTSAGTTLVIERPGEQDAFDVSSRFTTWNGLLFITACIGINRCEVTLLRSDGTAAGTIQLVAATPNIMVDSGGKLFFTTNNTTDGSVLWTTDGSVAGTVPVKQITPPGNEANGVVDIVDVNGTLFMATATQLWKSDGTAAGTTPIVTTGVGFNAAYLTNVNGLLLFTGMNSAGRELWKSDGTAAGTTLVKDINTSFTESGSYPQLMANLNGRLVFKADSGTHRAAIWQSNGTNAGTTLIKEFDTGNYALDRLFVAGQTLFFTMGQGALWGSDGTAAGTRLLRQFPYPQYSFADTPMEFTDVNGVLFFKVYNGFTGHELWKSDGTPAGTTLVKQFKFSASVHAELYGFIALDGKLIFNLANHDNPHLGAATADGCCSPSQVLDRGGLWKSDGTTAGTAWVADAQVDFGVQTNRAIAQGKVFFLTYDKVLWKSDGTTAGTSSVKQFNTNLTQLAQLISTGTTLFIHAKDEAHGDEIWKSDGTAAGTTLLRKFASSIDAPLTQANGKVFFLVGGANSISQLWQSDGTVAGTQLVKEFPGAGSLAYLISANQALLFFHYSQGWSLWKSDGTTAGTVPIQALTPTSDFNAPPTSLIAGPHIFLAAADDHLGVELWALRIGQDTQLHTPQLVGAPPVGAATIPIEYGNQGLTATSAATLTATLPAGLSYISDTSGISPTVSGNLLTWHLPPPQALSSGSFTLQLRTPAAAYGTRYSVKLTLAVAGQESTPADNTTTVQVMIARQVYLPLTRR
jgi:ELWxxDGT repeat protein